MSGSGGAPTVPASPGTSLRTGCQTCQATAPCDCAKLVIKAEKGGTEPRVRELSTTRKLRNTPASRRLQELGYADLLRRYDLVIECVVGYLDRMDPPAEADRVTLKAETEWDPTCSNGRVHQIVLAPRDFLEQGMPVRGPTAVASPRPLYLDWQPLDQLGGDNPLGALLGVFAMLVGSQVGAKAFEVEARSCGVRPGGIAPNGTLTGVFLFYRKMKIELNIQLPAMREVQRVRGTGTIDMGGGTQDATFRTRTTTTRYLPGTGTRTPELNLAAAPVARTDLPGLARSPDLAGSRAPEVVGGSSATVGQDTKVTIKVNGRELDASEWVRRILRVKERIEGVLDTFIDAIQKAPQVGWRFEYTYQFLTGSIGADFERQEDPRAIDERLLRAPKYLTLRAEITVLKLNATLSFGFHFQGRWGTATAQIRGSIGGEVSTRANIRIPGGDRKWTMSGGIPIEVSAVAELTLRETRVASASLTAASGFEISGTLFDDEPPQTPQSQPYDPWVLEFKLKLKKGTLAVRIEDAYTGFIRWNTTVDVWNERDLWSSRGSQ